MDDEFPTLPALKSLGDLADMRPTIVIDSREQMPLTFNRLESTRGTLTTGDYSFIGGQEIFAIERKSIPDLVGCCCGENRERFARELHRLRGFQFKRLVIVGHVLEIEQHTYRSRLAPKTILHTLSAFEVRYDCPVIWATTPEDAAVRIQDWVWWFSREIVQNANALRREGMAQ
jgi:DNA excision repair protein ERCC-4